MFSSEYISEDQSKLVKSYNGVDLINYTCVRLEKTPLYEKYQRNDLHYIVGAVQKGLKPYSQHGLRRIKRKNARKLAQQNIKRRTKTEAKAPQLNPQSPEVICMKALRTEFLSTFANQEQAIKPTRPMRSRQNIKSKGSQTAKNPKIMKKKLNQRKRRNELIKLVKKYREVLYPHFEQRLLGYGRCPKVSRQEIKDFLYQKGIVPDIGPEKFNPQLTPYNYKIQPVPMNQQLFHISELNDKIEHGLKINGSNGSEWIINPNLTHETPKLNEDDFPSLLG